MRLLLKWVNKWPIMVVLPNKMKKQVKSQALKQWQRGKLLKWVNMVLKMFKTTLKSIKQKVRAIKLIKPSAKQLKMRGLWHYKKT